MTKKPDPLLDELRKRESIYIAILEGADIPLPPPDPILDPDDDFEMEDDFRPY